MSQENGASSAVHVCEELLELATVGLYRNNLFRVLCIPVHAGPAEVRQRQKKLDMQRKLGLAAESGSAGIFVLNPPPSADVTGKAIERMNDPVARFLDEVFWFTAPAGDAGLAALERGSVAEARNAWKQIAGKSGMDTIHALHNLAVLDHLLALEGPNYDGSASAALASWKGIIDGEAYWDRVRFRIGEMNDARLTTGFVRRLRSTLPGMLMLTFARLAVSAAERGDAGAAAAMVKTMRQSGYGETPVDEALREALKPLRSRISAAVASAKNKWTKTPQHGDRIIRELHATVKPLLDAFDRAVDDDLSRQGVHDEVAEAMNLAEVAFCKATNNWSEGEKLLAIAKGVAIGQRLKDKIDDNIRIDQENSKSGNDWCAPGYWDLAPEVVAELEKARAQAEAGGFDAALEILLNLDKGIGFPLVRAVAHCMSVKAIRKFNEAIGEFNAEGGVLKSLMDNIRNKNSSTLMALFQPPQPYMNSWQLPSCPVCGSSAYTSWTNFKFKDLPMWMCSSCSSRHNSYVEGKKRTFVNAISEPLQYLGLAARLDPADPGIRRNKEGIEKTAQECGHYGTPDVDGLTRKLTKKRVRRSPVSPQGSPTDTCFFCGQRQGDASLALGVPMHGPVARTEFLLGNGVYYEYGDILVPRCVECHKHHEDWPVRIETWHEAALSEAVPENFPEARAEEASTRGTAQALAKGSSLADKSVERARAALNRARESQGFLARILRRPNPAHVAASAALDAAQRQKAMAQERSGEAAEKHKRAREILQGLRKRTVDAYKAEHPMPQLPAGVRPEDDLLEAPVIAAQKRKSWDFGDTADSESDEVAPKGMVSRSPKLRELEIDEKKVLAETKGKDARQPPPLSKKKQGDWSSVKLCASCGKGNPKDAVVCIDCGGTV